MVRSATGPTTGSTTRSTRPERSSKLEGKVTGAAFCGFRRLVRGLGRLEQQIQKKGDSPRSKEQSFNWEVALSVPCGENSIEECQRREAERKQKKLNKNAQGVFDELMGENSVPVFSTGKMEKFRPVLVSPLSTKVSKGQFDRQFVEPIKAFNEGKKAYEKYTEELISAFHQKYDTKGFKKWILKKDSNGDFVNKPPKKYEGDYSVSPYAHYLMQTKELSLEAAEERAKEMGEVKGKLESKLKACVQPLKEMKAAIQSAKSNAKGNDKTKKLLEELMQRAKA